MTELSRRNRRWLAKDWPDGILEVCERLDDVYPGWHVSWMAENTIKGWERPAGFTASRTDLQLVGGDELRPGGGGGGSHNLRVFATDPDELGRRITAMMERVEEKAEEKAAHARWMRTRPSL